MGQQRIVALVLVWITLGSVTLAHAQTVKDIGNFWAMGKAAGTVQLLPGGMVLKREGGKSMFYSYRKGKFVITEFEKIPIPTAVIDWSYFDWDDVDHQNQVDRGTFDIPRDTFLPRSAKVKKVIYVPNKNAPQVVALVCYTVPEKQEENPMPGADSIFLLAVRGDRKDAGYSYQMLWTQKLQRESNYGDLILQDLPGVGKVLALYSSAPGGSSEDRQLDLYSLLDFPAGGPL